jgi:alpha-tubulin suppressor-like RCC1 family protein
VLAWVAVPVRPAALAAGPPGIPWAWGSNATNQLGDGTTITRLTPVQVSGLSDIVAVAGGEEHSAAVKADGTAWGWGGNIGGQLGDGTGTRRASPVQTLNLSGVVAVGAGEAREVNRVKGEP